MSLIDQYLQRVHILSQYLQTVKVTEICMFLDFFSDQYTQVIIAAFVFCLLQFTKFTAVIIFTYLLIMITYYMLAQSFQPHIETVNFMNTFQHQQLLAAPHNTPHLSRSSRDSNTDRKRQSDYIKMESKAKNGLSLNEPSKLVVLNEEIEHPPITLTENPSSSLSSRQKIEHIQNTQPKYDLNIESSSHMPNVEAEVAKEESRRPLTDDKDSHQANIGRSSEVSALRIINSLTNLRK